MVRYLALVNFTEQGIRTIKQSPERALGFEEMVQAAGGKVLGIYWALGEADGALLFEAPDETTATAILLNLGGKGNVRTRTLRIFDAQEFAKIVAKV